MRTIDRTAQFKKDYKREKKRQHRVELDKLLADTVTKLAQDKVLLPKFKDHALIGNWVAHRDCHLKPDLVLIYRKSDDEHLQLVRLGSHAELSL